jgi:hypothetical protein
LNSEFVAGALTVEDWATIVIRAQLRGDHRNSLRENETKLRSESFRVMPRDPSTSLRSAQDDRIELLDDLERRPLAVARSGTGKQRADRLNGLAVSTDDPADIALPHLQFENGHLSARDLREHDLVGKLYELTNDELEKLFHGK